MNLVLLIASDLASQVGYPQLAVWAKWPAMARDRRMVVLVDSLPLAGE